MIDKNKINELIKSGYEEFENVKISPNIYSLAVAFSLRDILEEIEKEINKEEL